MDEEFESPCARWHHEHPPVRNVNEEYDDALTSGQRIADKVASAVGSWPFIITQSIVLVAWIIANVWLAFHPEALKSWDPYPFILLNLMLSFQAAYTGPVVMMSQNRQSEKDRLTARRDYEVDSRAESEIAVIMDHLLHQDRQIDALRAEVASLTALLRASRS